MITFKISHPITVDDLESYPDALRYELHHGTLCIMSSPIRWHSRISRCVASALERAGMAAYQRVGVRFGDDDKREPDIAVFKQRPVLERSSFPPQDFQILIEVVTKATEAQARILKPIHYARAGIPEYWRVERDPEDIDDALIHRHELSADGAYVETGVVRLSELEASLTRR